MSTLLLLRTSAGAAVGGGSTAIPAILTQQGASPTTGAIRYTGVFPLPPDGAYAMSPTDVVARKFSIWIGGVEQSIHCEAARGAHSTGAVSGVRYDFDYTVGSTADVVAEVRIGTVRGTTDRASRRTITKTQYDARNWLLATDTTFLCSTWLTAQPLVPIELWNAAEVAWLKTQMDTALSGLAEDSTAEPAFYDAPRHLMALWCCTGDVSYLRRAVIKVGASLPLFFPTTGTYTPALVGIMDTESLSFGVDTVDGQANETKSVFERSCAGAYLVTGWSYPWAAVNNFANAATRSSSSWATGLFAANSNANIRFNLWKARWWLAASSIDATYRYANTDFPLRQETFATEAPGWLTDLDANKYDTSRGAYRENFRGLNPGENAQSAGGTFAGIVIAPGTNGVHPTFQTSVINDAMLDWYHDVYADSRVPGWIKTNVDVVLANAAPLPSNHYYENNGTGTGKWAVPYLVLDVASTANSTDGGPSSSGDKNDPFDICMHLKALGFLAAKYPVAVSNGKTYAEWRDLLMDPKQLGGLIWNYKFIGEQKATMSLPFYRIHGDPGGPSSIREPVVYTNQPS